MQSLSAVKDDDLSASLCAEKSRSNFHSLSFTPLCKNENDRVEAAASAVGNIVALPFGPFPPHVTTTTGGAGSVCIERAGGRLSSHSFSGSSRMANVSNKTKEMFFQCQSHTARVARSFQRQRVRCACLPKGREVRRLLLSSLETSLRRRQGSGTGRIYLF